MSASRRALVIGASGQVGAALTRALEGKGWEVSGTGLDRAGNGLLSLDVASRDQVLATIRSSAPDVIFLAAGATNVDACEDDPDWAQRVNVEGARHVAEAAAAGGHFLVYYSSDYIFDGRAGPYREDDVPRPLSVYGRTKAAAEDFVARTLTDHLIIRTTVVYGWDRASMNFAAQLWQRLSAGDPFRVAADQESTPTLVDYLAEVSLRLVEAGVRGVVNVVGRDRLSRADFARRLAATFGLDPALIQAVPTAELGQRAPRPLQAGLKTARMESLLGTEAMSLDEALKRVRRQWRADTHIAAGPARPTSQAEALKREILDRVREYRGLAHGDRPFTPMVSRVPYAGRVFGDGELVNLVDASLDFWLTLGPWGDLFEQTLRRRLGVRDVALVNSGSSANLAAVTALTAPQLDDPLRPGDEVITSAVTFPTTLAPLLQNGLVPVLVDCEIGTYNINPALIEAAVSPRTRAIMVPHTLGIPCDLDVICDVASRHRLYLIEDCCDALGSRFRGRPVGTFGDLATLSFYPAHHITMGEGGAVLINRPRLGRAVRSVRDWGRDCWCAPGESNTCGKRFGWKFGQLPEGYDHKYTYTTIGYNLKPTDLQAAIGVAQLKRLDGFIASRRANFHRLYQGLEPYQDHLILPSLDPRSEPSWFAFPITVREGTTRRRLVQWLEDSNIETRDVFGGNIIKQPAYARAGVRVHGELTQTDRVLHDTFFIGVYPGLTPQMIEFVIERFEAFFETSRRQAAA